MQKRILCNISGIVSQCNNIMVHSHVPHSMTREWIQDIIVPQWLTRWHDQEHRNRLLSSICPLSIHKIHPLKPNHCHCIIHRETMATNVAMVVFTPPPTFLPQFLYYTCHMPHHLRFSILEGNSISTQVSTMRLSLILTDWLREHQCIWWWWCHQMSPSATTDDQVHVT